ncbi:threonine/serine exporter family protein [Propionispora hippei]|uniref:Uncharacterized membrane protein YjjB, DUF3815 family n=1 Tax=Propionispora hippei DSM 15287 TaxID=1123003 RepID=A0A1M6JN51_9FIRM|nr:threonine/serine exporter family protein [Propionispora hippei]SHJ48145.1 Uncharacterized membrane protein YjjB, DUF3815 family [Propionispora hippei DSM 15287]
MVIFKLVAVFLMSVSVGVLYRIPRSLLLYAGGVGVAAWGVMYLAGLAGANPIMANFLASIVIGVSAELLARLLKKPATIFIIPAFFPLVPGSEAYTTMLYMVKGHYVDGVSMAMRTVLTGAAIAFGIFSSSTVYRLVINYNKLGRVGKLPK